VSKLERGFYLRDTLEVAQDLVGCKLVRASEEGTASGIIVETEAYIGPQDQASHARNHISSRRTRIQYEQGGFAYVYMVYGMHHCLNVVCAEEGKPEVVLIRALEPLENPELMAERRGFSEVPKDLRKLASGPGRLCRALGIDLDLYGADLCGDRLWIEPRPREVAPEDMLATRRINVDYAGEWKDRFWRIILKSNRYVSR
jgi:DNA-3-methyladenine glycosylase